MMHRNSYLMLALLVIIIGSCLSDNEAKPRPGSTSQRSDRRVMDVYTWLDISKSDLKVGEHGTIAVSLRDSYQEAAKRYPDSNFVPASFTSAKVPLQFNPKVIKIIGGQGGSLLVNTGAEVEFTYQDGDDFATIQIKSPPDKPLPGEGEIAIFQFEAIGPGNSWLLLNNFALTQPNCFYSGGQVFGYNIRVTGTARAGSAPADRATEKNISDYLAAEKRDVDRRTALMFAAQDGNEKVVAELIERGVNLNLQDNQSETALMKAANYNRIAVVHSLIKAGAAVDINAGFDINALWLSAHGEPGLEVMRALIDAGADRQRVLLHAARDGDLPALKALIELGAKINFVCINKKPNSTDGFWLEDGTALIAALKKSRAQIVKYLLENGADVNLANSIGKTPLMQAVDLHTEKILRDIDWYGPGFKDLAKTERFSNALMAQITKLTEQLISAGADIKARDNQGRTALIYAVEPNSLGAIKRIYTTTTDFDKDYFKPIFKIAELLYQSRINVVKVLLKAGVEVNAQDNQGQTALMVAAELGDLVTAKALIDAGAKLDLKDKAGHTALELAQQHNQTELINLLKAKQ